MRTVRVWIQQLNGHVFEVDVDCTQSDWDLAEQIEGHCSDFHRMFQQLMKIPKEGEEPGTPFFPFVHQVPIQEDDWFFLLIVDEVWVRLEDHEDFLTICFGPVHVDAMERSFRVEPVCAECWRSGCNIYQSVEQLVNEEVATRCDFPLHHREQVVEKCMALISTHHFFL